MTPPENQPALEQLREDVALLRGQLHQLAAQLARIDTRTETHGLARRGVCQVNGVTDFCGPRCRRRTGVRRR
jgi:hypothetical protein